MWGGVGQARTLSRRRLWPRLEGLRGFICVCTECQQVWLVSHHQVPSFLTWVLRRQPRVTWAVQGGPSQRLWHWHSEVTSGEEF